jgi:hypothetical protein
MKTTIEWLEHMLSIILNEEEFKKITYTIEQAKEMEKENTCYFGAKCCIMTTQKKEWTLEQLYKETFNK